MNSNICHDTLVGIPEYLHKHQDVLLSIAELPTFYIANVRFSRFLSHPFWYKSHFFHKRKDEFEHLSRYTCWHTRVPSKTPGRLALHRRTSYILHCKCAIFPIFEPSLLIQKSFFSQKKRWIRTSVTIHLLAYQSTFTNTRTCCSPSQNFLHFTLQMCDFPDFWAIPFDTKVIFFTKEKMNSNICHDTLVGIPEYLQKHQEVLLSIAELPTFYIANVRFSRFLSHFWYKSHFFHKRKDDSKICHDTLVGIPEYLHKHRDVLLSTAELPTFYIAKVRFSIFEPSLLRQKSFFSQKKRWIRTSVTRHLLAYQSTFKNTRLLLSIAELPTFYIAKCNFPNFWAIPFDTKVIFSQKKRWIRKSVMINLLAYQSTFINTRTCCSPSQNFLHFTLQRCDFPDFWAIPFDTKVIFFTKEKMNSNICHDTLVGIPEYLQKHQASCSPSQNFLHFTLQRCDFPDFWAIPFDTKVIFFTKEKMNSNICHDTLVGIPEYLHKHQDVLLSIAELPTFYIASVRFWFLSHPFWYKSHFFHKRKDEFENLSRYTCWHTRVPSKTPGRVALHRRTSYILHCKVRFSRFLSHPFWYKSHFFHKRKDEFEHLSRYTCWHTRVPS